MKTYKDFEKRFVGSSDIAQILIRSNEVAQIVKFGKDGGYDAYIVPEKCEISAHYSCEAVLPAQGWIWIYDDQDRVKTISGDFKAVEIYRAREMGCIVKILNGAENLAAVEIE